MAQKRASLASHALEDLHTDLPSVRQQREPVEAPEAQDELPASSNPVREFVSHPLGQTQFPSVARAGAKDRLVPFPIRLRLSQVERFEELKEKHGIVPSELVRDFIDECLPRIKL